MNINLARHIAETVFQQQIEANLHFALAGPPRLGIVHEIAHELMQLDVDIQDCASRVYISLWPAEPLFVADLDTYSLANFDLDELRDWVDGIQEVITLEIENQSLRS